MHGGFSWQMEPFVVYRLHTRRMWCLSFRQSVCLSPSVCLSVRLSVCPSLLVPLFIEWKLQEVLGKRSACFMIIKWWPISWFLYQGRHFTCQHVDVKRRDVTFYNVLFKIFQNFTVFWLPMNSGPPGYFISSVRLIICVIKSCVQKY